MTPFRKKPAPASPFAPMTAKELSDALAVPQDNPVLRACVHILRACSSASAARLAACDTDPRETDRLCGGMRALAEAEAAIASVNAQSLREAAR